MLTGEAAVTPRRRGPGHGRRRPRQHRLADPVARPSRAPCSSARRRGGHRRRRSPTPAPACMSSRARASRCELWQALRVAAQRRGMGRSAGLEAPFVGRTAELRLVKDMFHASADEARARLVSVVGVAGIGKSRLAWEFEKYIDGLAADVGGIADAVSPTATASRTGRSRRWCVARAEILEDEGADSSVAKVRAVLEANVAEQDERDWIEPRLLQLLGLSDRTSPDREDLFSAWRRFFERLAEQGPLVMVFEDIHWADEGLVAFVEYLLDWGRHHPIFVAHAGAPGGGRSPSVLPGFDAELDDAAARPTRRHGNGRAAPRARARAARRRSGAPARGRGRHPALRRRDRADAARPRRARAGRWRRRRHRRPHRVRGAADRCTR